MKRLLHGRIARGSIATLAIRVSALGFGFLQTLVLARLLGSESYGQVVAVVSGASMAAWIGVLGLNGLAVRDIARYRLRGDAAAERSFLRFSLIVIVGGSGLAGAAVHAVAAPSLPDIAGWIFVLAPTIALALLFRGASLGRGEVIWSQAPIDILRPALFFVAVIVAVASIGLTAEIAIVLNTAAFIVAMSVAGRRLLIRTPEAAGDAAPPVRALKDAMPFFLAGVFASLQSEMIVLMLTVLSTPDQTGIFQVAFRISTLLLVVRQAIDVPLSPRFVTLWESGSRDELERLACLSAAASTAAALLIWIGVFAISGPLTALFGSDFTAARSSLILLTAAQVLFVAAGPLPVLLNMADRPGTVTVALGVAQAVQFLLGFVLIPNLGAFGAAIAMSAAIIAWSLGMWIAARRGLGVRISPFRGIAIYARRGLR